jgi:hypothetical protein
MIPHTGKVAKYFYDHFSEIRPSTNGWMDFECPVCGRFKGAVNFYQQRVKCWHGCFHNDVEHFVALMENVSREEAKALVLAIPGEVFVEAQTQQRAIPKLGEEKAIPYPDYFEPISKPSPNIGMRAVHYLVTRGFDIDYMDYLGVGYCYDGKYKGRIIIPFFVDGRLRFYQGRSFMSHVEPKYLNPKFEEIGVAKEDLVYNERALSLFDEVFITEGALDAICLSEAATSTQGWSVSRWQLMKYMNARATQITIVPDVGYYDKALELAGLLVNRKQVRVLNVDILSSIGKDVNEIGAANIWDLRDSTPILTEGELFNLQIDRL